MAGLRVRPADVHIDLLNTNIRTRLPLVWVIRGVDVGRVQYRPFDARHRHVPQTTVHSLKRQIVAAPYQVPLGLAAPRATLFTRASWAVEAVQTPPESGARRR